MKLNDLNVVFAGCARDCEPFISETLKNLDLYSSNFAKCYKIIVENGSKDKTREILKKKQKHGDFFLFRDDLNNFPYRGHRLERARNLIIQTIKENSQLSSCDLFIMVDLDKTGTFRISDSDIKDSIEFLFLNKNTAGVFANQLGTYYDMWTLRDEKYCNNDFWVEVLQHLTKNKNFTENISEENLLDVKKKIIEKKTYSFDKNLAPIPVKSAFGGFGIYKMSYVLKNKKEYEGDQIIDLISKDKKKIKVKFQKCEHVNFNLGLIEQNGKLYILPNLINRAFSEFSFSPSSALQLIIKD